MAVSMENALSEASPADERRRAGRELVLELVFAPLANALVPLVLAVRVSPLVVALANAATGLAGAVALAMGELVLAAGLVQLKTLLDNLDGRVARASGRVSLAGRYLDTEADMVVVAALFAGLAHVTGRPWLALGSLCALTLVLAVDFNLSELHRAAHGRPSPRPPSSGSVAERVLERVYRTVFGPMDTLVEWVVDRRLERLLATEADSARRERATLAFHDTLTVTVLANLGLSTQLVVLGVFLVVGAPTAYLWLVATTVLLLPILELVREHRVRQVLAR